MPIGSPFHERVRELCTSYRWRDWGGYYAVSSFDSSHDREYYALRNGAGAIDVTPLFKYEVTGPDAGRFLARVMVKDVRKLKMNQVTYLCWCDDEGKVIDDGTVTRLGENHYRVTAAEPSYSWFIRLARAYDVKIEDTSNQMAALAVQGPNSREVLKQICNADLNGLRFFRHTYADFQGGFKGEITRTGYTGDLGYEVWVKNEDALKLYDAVLNEGNRYGLLPCGIEALDVTRVEAGFIMNGVDYYSAHHCITESRMSTPYELNLGWTVSLDRDPFIGQEALIKEKAKGSAWATIGLVLDWDDYEAIHLQYGLPPSVCTMANRDPVPLYDSDMAQVGYATTRAWSPVLKKNLAIATVESHCAAPGTELRLETTVQFKRHTIGARVTEMPFFNPERKRSVVQ